MSRKNIRTLPPDLLDERLLSANQIAELECTSVKSVRRKMASRALPVVRLSANCVRVRVGDWRAVRKVGTAA